MTKYLVQRPVRIAGRRYEKGDVIERDGSWRFRNFLVDGGALVAMPDDVPPAPDASHATGQIEPSVATITIEDEPDEDDEPDEVEATDEPVEYACDDCERTFKSPSGLASHRRSVHGDV